MDGGNGTSVGGSARSTQTIQFEFERLPMRGKPRRSGAPPPQAEERTLRVLVGTGRGAVLHGGDLPPLVLVPLRGTIRIVDGEGVRPLGKGELLVAEAGQCLQVIGSNGALWVALTARATVWRHLIGAVSDTPVGDPVLLPAVYAADLSTRRTAVRLAREAWRAGWGRSDAMSAALRFAALLAELQATFDPLIARCPGRTMAQRRSVFLRLQRVYNWMQSSSAVELGVGEFARIANYSTCHFVRTFAAVYGQTPHTVLMEQRLKRAFRLVYDTGLSITEVARASGFEDRCAFARSFKRRFGKTATDVRITAAAVGG
jgi:AraC family transcriptional regulator